MITEAVVPPVAPLWNMRRVGRMSDPDTPMQRARLARGLRQADLAERLDVATATIQRWETGNRTPDAKDLVRLADVLGTSIDELLGREPPLAAAEPRDLPLPSDSQLAEVLAGLLPLYFPGGQLDADKMLKFAAVLRETLAQYAENPAGFDDSSNLKTLAVGWSNLSLRRSA